MLQPLLFALLLLAAFGLFAWQVRKIRANILVGRDRDMSGHPGERLTKTLLVAFGQQKMFKLICIGFILNLYSFLIDKFISGFMCNFQ